VIFTHQPFNSRGDAFDLGEERPARPPPEHKANGDFVDQ
jgi:hypothetical protein